MKKTILSFIIIKIVSVRSPGLAQQAAVGSDVVLRWLARQGHAAGTCMTPTLLLGGHRVQRGCVQQEMSL